MMKHGKSIAALVLALAFTLVAGQASADSRDRDRDRSRDRAVAHHSQKGYVNHSGHREHWKHHDRRFDHKGWDRGHYKRWDRGHHKGHYKRHYKHHHHGYAYGRHYRPPHVVRYVPVPSYRHGSHSHGNFNLVLKF